MAGQEVSDQTFEVSLFRESLNSNGSRIIEVSTLIVGVKNSNCRAGY